MKGDSSLLQLVCSFDFGSPVGSDPGEEEGEEVEQGPGSAAASWGAGGKVGGARPDGRPCDVVWEASFSFCSRAGPEHRILVVGRRFSLAVCPGRDSRMTSGSGWPGKARRDRSKPPPARPGGDWPAVSVLTLLKTPGI